MTLIIVALVPYTLTVVAVVVSWFDERLYEIARKNPTGRDPLTWPPALVGIRPRDALHFVKKKTKRDLGIPFHHAQEISVGAAPMSTILISHQVPQRKPTPEP
jgi:hypothetical protein